jgi:two-component system chemotaxis sensor kinase CheA
MDEDKYIKIYCSELEEHINAISSSLKTLGNDPKDEEAINVIMRRLHSIKGISATMGYSSVSELSHLTEDLVLSYVNKALALDDKILKLVYDAIYAIENFKLSLPEEKNELIKKTLKKLQKAIKGKIIKETVSDEGLVEKINSSVNEMLNSIDNNIKISVSIIDNLIDEISELKYTESALKNLNEKINSYKLKLNIKKIEDQLKKLYKSLIQLKMQPFDTIINQLERFINEYCLTTGKKIDFTANTNNIVIDSTVLKVLISPLIHLIRNAIDHGIESINERKKAGKPAKGKVSLIVKKVHDFAQITVSDDGGGIAEDKVVEKAVKKGYIKKEPETLDSNFLLFVLTHPGFTTKNEVSMVSGRGIGLDVVKSSLENIGGSVSLQTSKTKGTKIILKVPVTTAVIKSVLVKAAKETVAIPSSNIEKILIVTNESLLTGADGLEAGYLYEGEKVKVNYLGSLLGFAENGEKDEYNMLLVRRLNEIRAFLVDDLVSEEDLFIKPLARPLKKLSTVLGYSISGDGTPVILLDVNNL